MLKHQKIIYLAGFLFSLPIALASYINSSFLANFVGEKFTGIVYTIGSIASILILILIPKIFSKVGGYKFLVFTSLLNALSFFVLTFVNTPVFVLFFFVFIMMLNTLIIFSLDEILKIFSINSETGKTRGIYISICSLAWVVSQVLNATIFGDFSFRQIYFVSSMIMLCFLILILFNLKHIKEPNYDKTTTIKYIKQFWNRRELLRIYSINFLLHFFFAWMVIYTPIYLSTHLGFSWKDISIIFATMLLPFLFFPIKLGKYADKIGERKMLINGFIIMSLSTLVLFFIDSHNLIVWASLLFTTRIGGSIIEAMSDAYFFKHINSENEQFIGVYRSASPVAYVIGPLVAFGAFLFIPSFNYIYLILGAIMLTGVYISSQIKTTDI
jgi:MFS family permease